MIVQAQENCKMTYFSMQLGNDHDGRLEPKATMCKVLKPGGVCTLYGRGCEICHLSITSCNLYEQAHSPR